MEDLLKNLKLEYIMLVLIIVPLVIGISSFVRCCGVLSARRSYERSTFNAGGRANVGASNYISAARGRGAAWR